MNVTTGTLDLSGGGTDVGAIYEGTGTDNSIRRWHPDAGCHIEHYGKCTVQRRRKTFTVNGGAGTGLMTVTAGTATFNGTVNTGGLTQSGGELNGTGTLTVTGHRPSRAGRRAGRGRRLRRAARRSAGSSFGLDGGRTLQLGGASTATGPASSINLNSTNPTTGTSDPGSGI